VECFNPTSSVKNVSVTLADNNELTPSQTIASKIQNDCGIAVSLQ